MSAERTPVNPPAPSRLVPLDQTVAPIHYEGNAKHDPDCPCEACVPYLAGSSASAGELLGYQVDPSSSASGGFMSVSAPPPPPPPTPGLGRPETNRKEARWERAITWLLSRRDER